MFLRAFVSLLSLAVQEKNSLHLKKCFKGVYLPKNDLLTLISWNTRGEIFQQNVFLTMRVYCDQGRSNCKNYKSTFKVVLVYYIEAIQCIFLWKYRSLSHYSLIIISTDFTSHSYFQLFKYGQSKRVTPDAIDFHVLMSSQKPFTSMAKIIVNFLFSIWW